MDSNAHCPGLLVIPALARDEPAAAESPSATPAPVALLPPAARTRSPPETVWPETRAPHALEELSALIGALSLRALRSQQSSR